MAVVETNPAFSDLLRREGLTAARDFLDLTGVIVSGHPDRHVLQLKIGAGAKCLRCFMKREHRVRLKDRLNNAWAGFGMVSKSIREGRLLKILPRAGIGSPQWIAAGEDNRGRAFLLLRECIDFVDLRVFLRNLQSLDARKQFLSELGKKVAKIHCAGFDHPDLFSKHIIVNTRNHEVVFLDWQRSRRWQEVPRTRRLRELAALQATLAEDLITFPERFLVFQSYFEFVSSTHAPSQLDFPEHENEWLFIGRETDRLLQRRRIREIREPPLASGTQSLVWLRGEAVCATAEFIATGNARTSEWLEKIVNYDKQPCPVAEMPVQLPDGRNALLVRRSEIRPVVGLWSFLRRRLPRSPELKQVATLYHLQRYGIATPRLLAFGQHSPSLWRTESFLLTKPVPGQIGFIDWLVIQNESPCESAGQKNRRMAIRAAATVVRKTHAAGYVFAPSGWAAPGFPLVMHWNRNRQLLVGLSGVAGLRKTRLLHSAGGMSDLAHFQESVTARLLSRTDALRFFLAYLGEDRLTQFSKMLVRRIANLGIPSGERLRFGRRWKMLAKFCWSG